MVFTYEIPEWAEDKILPGMRVIVPFRRTHTVGIVVRLLGDTKLKRTKMISELPDDKPLFTSNMMNLLYWLSNYYACPLGDTYRAALPGGIGIDVERIIALDLSKKLEGKLPKKAQAILELLNQSGELKEDTLRNLVGKNGFFPAMDELRAKGVIRIQLRSRRTKKIRTVLTAKSALNPDEISEVLAKIRSNASNQRGLLELLAENPKKEHIRRDLSSRFGAATIKKAVDNNWLTEASEEVYRRPGINQRLVSHIIPPILTEAQSDAVKTIMDSIVKREYKTFLLWGVTGSGKTEVYMRAALTAREANMGVLLLVPEIALTPQLWGCFEARFPNEVAVLHSALKPGERFDAWRRLADGDLKIAIGPRSAVFAPVQNLGLIVIDEEHESSYKQEEPPPYYNARDAAIVRASIEKCPVILGSATPSAESYYNSLTGKYHLLEMPERIPGAELPGVRIVDMTQEREEFNNYASLSRELEAKLIETIDRGFRAMLLINRRGFSSFLQCPDCGYIPTCEACGIGLTYHKTDNTLRCHYCAAESEAPAVCPECGSSVIKFRGHGTERIEEELAEIIPPEKIFRLDADSAKIEGAAKILNDFQNIPGSVLIGTQMIAKGHDFPDVALVGVINADIGLTMPDFRSTEKIFQLINQVAGRAGRSEIRGEVIIQTHRPDSPAIDFAVNSDVKSFFETELKSRKELKYPPFGRIVRVIVSGKDPSDVRLAIFRLKRELRRIDSAGNKYGILGPATCPLSKLREQYRWHLLLKTEKPQSTVEIVKRITSKLSTRVQYKIVVDPNNLM